MTKAKTNTFTLGLSIGRTEVDYLLAATLVEINSGTLPKKAVPTWEAWDDFTEAVLDEDLPVFKSLSDARKSELLQKFLTLMKSTTRQLRDVVNILDGDQTVFDCSMPRSAAAKAFILELFEVVKPEFDKWWAKYQELEAERKLAQADSEFKARKRAEELLKKAGYTVTPPKAPKAA